jgi:hypothetical protein
VTSKIGSQGIWAENSIGVSNQFTSTGDWMRSSRSNLEMVINAGVRTVIYDGDADYVCNYIGFEAMVRPTCFLLPPLPAFALTHCACAG